MKTIALTLFGLLAASVVLREVLGMLGRIADRALKAHL